MNETQLHIKHRPIPAKGRGLLLFLLLLVCAKASCITKTDADNEYKKGNYQQAIIDYNELLAKGVSADLYYNLGNAYYRSDNLTQAILAYERANLLSSGDKDIRFNLQFARSKTIDKVTPESEMFFISWYKSLVNLTDTDTWAYLGIASIMAALALVLLFLFSPRLVVRRISFYGAVLFVVVFVLSTLFAWQQKSAIENRTGAIIIAPTVNVKKTPVAGSTDSFVLHEGTRVDITDSSIKGWKGIRVADGREGWMKDSQLEKI